MANNYDYTLYDYEEIFLYCQSFLHVETPNFERKFRFLKMTEALLNILQNLNFRCHFFEYFL